MNLKKLLLLAFALLAVTVQGMAQPYRQDNNTNSDTFAKAMALMNTNGAESLKNGLAMLEKLSDAGYVPAIYELAFTYGWYSDTKSVKRKKLLGIVTDDNYLPKERSYTQMAVSYFEKILQLDDAVYPDINANAAYRLSLYYVIPNNFFILDNQMGKKHLLTARYWAEKAGNASLLKNINEGLSALE